MLEIALNAQALYFIQKCTSTLFQLIIIFSREKCKIVKELELKKILIGSLKRDFKGVEFDLFK